MTPITTRRALTHDLPVILRMIHALAMHHDDVSILTLAELERDALGTTPWITILVGGTWGRVAGLRRPLPFGAVAIWGGGMEMHHLFVQPNT